MANVTENILLGNFVSTTLASDINDSVLAMTVTSVTGMPTPTGTQYFYLVLQKVSATDIREIVKCTNVDAGTKVLTIVRSQEGTDPLAWTAADTRVKLNITAATLEDIADEMTSVINYVTYLDPSIADQGDAAEVGSLAWHLADIGTSTHAQLIMRPGTYTVSTNITVTENITVKILPAALFDIDTDSVTLTFDGLIDAGAEPIRTIEAVPGNRLMVVNEQPGFVEWWVVEAGGTSSLINHATLDSASRGCKHLIFSRGAYPITGPISFQASAKVLEFTNSSYLNSHVDAADMLVTFTNQEIVAPFTAAPFGGVSANYTGPIGNNPISGHWFGAVGDGTTDDTTAILDVITFAGSNSIIQFSNSMTYLTQGVAFPGGVDNVTIAGGRFKRHNDGAGAIFSINEASNECVFRDGVYEVPDSVIAADVPCLNLQGPKSRIHNNTFIGSKASTRLTGQVTLGNGSYYSQISNNFFSTPSEESADGSFIAVMDTTETLVNNNICRGEADVGILFDSISGVCSSNDLFMDTTGSTYGIESGSPGIGALSDSGGGDAISITGNVIYALEAAATGIYLGENTDFVTVTGNVVKGCKGILIDAGANDVAITGNTFDSTKTQITNNGGTRITQHGNSGISSVPYVLITEREDEGVHGGTPVADTWDNPRVLNTESVDTDNLAAVVAGQIVLQPGVWRTRFSAIAYKSKDHKVRLRNLTADPEETLALGDSNYAGSVEAVSNASAGAGQFTITVETTIEVQHWMQIATPTWGFGYAGVAPFSGEDEIYCTVELWKVGEA